MHELYVVLCLYLDLPDIITCDNISQAFTSIFVLRILEAVKAAWNDAMRICVRYNLVPGYNALLLKSLPIFGHEVQVYILPEICACAN